MMKLFGGVLLLMVTITIVAIGTREGVGAQGVSNNGAQGKSPQVLTFSMEIDTSMNANSGQVKIAAGGALNIYKLDIPLTQVCWKEKKTVGHLRGWYANMNDDDSSSFFIQTATFDSLPPLRNQPTRKGTISFFGPTPSSSTFNQLPIVGGTGYFSLAQGVANVTCFEDAPNVFQYDLLLY